ncbi:MAG: MFS transporter [Actinobacteria bacterium]|nr:MAG: MFS transporter [Actinomycetota bacterium]
MEDRPKAKRSEPNDRDKEEVRGTHRLAGEALTPEQAVLERGLERLPTFRSLAYPDYRYFWIGALLSNTGTWMQMIAQGALIVFVLNGTAITVGLVNFASTLPVFFLSLPAGVLADHVDRRRLLIWAQVLLLIQALVLGYLTQSGLITVVSLSAIVFAAGLVTSFMFPAWQAMLPDLVPKRNLMNAIALNSAQFQSARFIGPAIASLILARIGYAEVFYINGLSFLAVIAALAVIRPKQEMRPRGEESVLQILTGGLRYARENTCVAVYLGTVAVVTLFGFFYVYLLPVIAKEFGVGPDGLGYLMAASGLGALAGALFVARLPHEARKDRLVKAGLVVLGALLLVFAVSPSPLLSSLLLVGVGGSFMFVTSSANTAIQSMVPGHIRGRIMALFVLSFMGLMPFSSLLGGFIAEHLGTSVAIGISGLALLAHGGLLYARPALLLRCKTEG